MSEQQGTPVKKRPKRKRHILRKLLILLLVLLVIAGGAVYAIESLRQEYTISYTGYTAATGSISNALSFSGSLGLVDNKTYTASADASVRTVYVQAGQNVKEGDKLLRLSDGSTVKADFDGRINTLKVAEGDKVAAGATLLQLADFTHMKVSIRVDEYDIADVAVGQNCTVTATATEKKFTSTIADIDYISAATGNVAYYTATAYVNVDEGIYPGMQVTISIPQEEAENVVVLKMDALSFDASNAAFVYKQGTDGMMTAVPVEVGVSNGNYVEIKSGVTSGEEVFAQVETETASSMAAMLSGIFGGQQVMPGGGMNRRNNTDGGFSFPGGDGGFSFPGGDGGFSFPGGGSTDTTRTRPNGGGGRQ